PGGRPMKQLHRRFAALGLAGAMVVGTATAAAAADGSGSSSSPSSSSSNASTSSSSACPNGAWPAEAEGAPAAFAAGAPAGAYIWHDADGWHLRVTHPGTDRVVFTGTVVANRKIEDHRILDEHNDRVRLNRRHDAFAFRLNNYGHIDGVDFRTACASVMRMTFAETVKTANGKVRTHQLSPSDVYLGANGAHPTSVPFRVERSK